MLGHCTAKRRAPVVIGIADTIRRADVKGEGGGCGGAKPNAKDSKLGSAGKKRASTALAAYSAASSRDTRELVTGQHNRKDAVTELIVNHFVHGMAARVQDSTLSLHEPELVLVKCGQKINMICVYARVLLNKYVSKMSSDSESLRLTLTTPFNFNCKFHKSAFGREFSGAAT
ncbi:hypothetical protein FVE85_6809 [Porphyridium purpureum]|uniref:Uncharacterized protein n=1 Tax=Porphyridium purpureum TaxID=35688 RepID=A0A5J4Z879_PORPP|nr:hypothetical protein FVE85_6809 [Porphyridium purpureum]|eukprot:POR4221..scf295_1